MTIEHEALEMNQAVAACDYILVSTAGGAACDTCRSSGKTHGWLVYDNNGIVENGEEMIIVSTGGTFDGSCNANSPIYPTAAGNAFKYKVLGGQVSTNSANEIEKILINMGMINTGSASHIGVVDGNGNIPGYSGAATASLTQNS